MTAEQPKLLLDFCDFWPSFDKSDNYFMALLRTICSPVLSATPDLLIYSGFGKSHLRYRCRKIFFTGESARPNFNECDYAFTCHHLDDERHYRLPLFILYGFEGLLAAKPAAEEILPLKTKFCSVLVSNPGCETRNNFFQQLSRYRHVDSGGSVMNNIGYRVPLVVNGRSGKLEFIKDFKFVLSFENLSCPGYTTEKLIEPMLVNSLPIYWGDPLAGRDFNSRSFINCHDYRNFDDVIERVASLDQDDELFKQTLREPWFAGGQAPPGLRREHIVERFRQIIGPLLKAGR